MSETQTLEPVASTNAIREHFPALARSHAGQPVAYFDGPGGTQVPRAVVEAVSDYLLRHNANTHWAFPTSQETDAIISESRHALADFLNAEPNEIAFGANMTTLTFHLARALGRGYERGDEVLITELEHHANVAPWQALAKERGIIVRVAKMIPETGQLDWKDFGRQLNARTKLVAIGAASNAIGTINDVPRAATMARAAGAQVFVDAVHYAPHELVDVRAFDCDFLSCSAYKFYGPHLGILFGRHDLLASLDLPRLLPAPNYAPDRFETGTQNFEGIAGAMAAVDFLASLAGPDAPPSWSEQNETRRERLRATFAELHERGGKLLGQLLEGLSRIDGVRVYGPAPDAPRTPTLAFTLAGVSSLAVSQRLAERGIFASNGDFYATTLVERMGQSRQGLVRAGCACYTTHDEVDRLIESVRAIAAAR